MSLGDRRRRSRVNLCTGILPGFRSKETNANPYRLLAQRWTMETVGLAFGVLGGADVCLRAGRSLYERYRSYKDAEQELKDLNWRLKNHWIKIESKISLIKDLNHVLEESHRIHFSELLEILERKLNDAQTRIDKVDRKQGRLKRAKFAALVKETLEASIAELDRWQGQLELPYFLITRISNPAVDQQLTAQRIRTSDAALAMKRLRETIKSVPQEQGVGKSIFVPATDLSEDGKRYIPYSTMMLAMLSRAGRHVLVDAVTSHVGYVVDSQVVMTGIRDVARILAQADPMTFGILTCHGVVKSTDSDGSSMFQFVFEIPDRLRNPRSLRHLLISSRGQHRPAYPLNERFDLAKRLARSVMFVHSSNLVHKNIRPDTIVVFQDGTSLGVPFLVGFEKIRSINAFTLLMGDAEWEKNLYRHPNRQGLRPEDSYKMQHDIYSLGVCLLEIGLWGSFVCWNELANSHEPGPDLNISAHLLIKDQRMKANQIKSALLEIACEQLPRAMGPKYADVVISCLTCLDRGNDGFGSEEEFMDADGILVGVRYVEKISMKLDEITV